MNKRKLVGGLLGLRENWLIGFLICLSLFILGVVLGSLTSADFCESGNAVELVGTYLDKIAEDGGTGGTVKFFIGSFSCAAAAFVMGFSIPGVVGIPALAALRGFSAGFAISVFTRLYGWDGALMGLTLVGVRAAVSTFLFLPVAAWSFHASFELACRGLLRSCQSGGIYTKAYFLRFFTAMILSLLLSAGGRALMALGISKLPAFL